MDERNGHNEKRLGRVLWMSRFIVLVPVVVCVVMALVAFIVATADVWYLVWHVGQFLRADSDAEVSLQIKFVVTIMKVMDIYLIAAFLIIFAFGLYELFISEIDVDERAGSAKLLLGIADLNDLKSRLGQVALLVLVVEFLQQALRVDYASARDLLSLSAGILAIGIALYLSARSGH